MCGVFGIWGHPEAANLVYLGLHALQHRGQESVGIVSADKGCERFARHLGRGLVADTFTPDTMAALPGTRSIGHVRYSTAGGSNMQGAQPISVETLRGPLSLCHNGTLINALEIRQDLERQGAIFSSPGDTEVLIHLIVRSRAPRIEDRIREALAQVQGAYTLVVLHPDGIIGLRDPSGYRPLVLGRLNGAYVLASETCALDLIEADFIREVEAGEMVCIGESGFRSERLVHDPHPAPRACIFELVYFARPDSQVFDANVYDARFEMGRQLAREAQPEEADLVIPVPDSGVAAALGFSDASGLPFRHGLIRSHYVGRTFIEPEQSIRHFGVKLKLSAVRSVLRDKSVVVVDDSLVRGTTSRKIVKMLRASGARKVHVRISSPPSRFPCYYGIDTPTREELVASNHNLEEISKFVTADSLAYLSEDGLHQSVKDQRGVSQRFCNACFTGDYATGADLIKKRLGD